MLDVIGCIPGSRTARVLCIGAHCDDIEIGCAGTLQVLQARRSNLLIDWVVLSGSEERRQEAERARNLLVRPRQRGILKFADFPDGHFPAHYASIKALFESLKRIPKPHLIFCHERNDRHQDHRIVNEIVWNTFRDHLVMEYEVPKWDGGLGQPNVYVPITASQAKVKVGALMQAYQSQRQRDWFVPETFMSLARLRGIECRAPSGLAEGFHGRKLKFVGF